MMRSGGKKLLISYATYNYSSISTTFSSIMSDLLFFVKLSFNSSLKLWSLITQLDGSFPCSECLILHLVGILFFSFQEPPASLFDEPQGAMFLGCPWGPLPAPFAHLPFAPGHITRPSFLFFPSCSFCTSGMCAEHKPISCSLLPVENKHTKMSFAAHIWF